MTQEERILDVLSKQYRKTVEEQLKAEDALESKYKLFEKNLSSIDTSLTNKINTFNSKISEIKVLFKKTLNDLKRNHKQQLDRLIKEKEKATDLFNTDLEEIDETLDKKRSLNVLKEEKIETDYQLALSQIETHYKEQRNHIQKVIEEASERYSSHCQQLEKETDIKQATEDNLQNQKQMAFSNAIDQIKLKSEQEISKIKQKLDAFEKQFSKTIKEAKQAYLDALKPIDNERTKLDDHHAQDLKDIDAHYETEISKKTKYQKEKEKIGDHTAASQYAKEIKKLLKTQKETIDRKTTAYEQAIIPIEHSLDTTKQDYQKKLYQLKKDGIEKIQLFLNSLIVQKTNELIDINAVNIQSLEQDARNAHKKATITIDHDIQRLNFDQTLEEARLHYQLNDTGFKPKEMLEQEDKKALFNQDKNEITKNRNTAKQLHKKDTHIRKLKQALTLEQLDYEKRRLESSHDFDQKNALIDHHVVLINKDNEKERLLSTHFYTHAKNFTALKNEAIMVFKPSVKKEIENRKTIQIKAYKEQIKQAERDHKIIMAKINDTFEQEIVIYETAYIDIEKEHQDTMQNLMTEQALERNRDLEAIAALDSKKDKTLIKKYKRNLALKQENHDEALALKKRDLEQKLAIYKKMIEQIKSFKLHSLEEADTLLMHIKDQLNHAIEHLEKASEQAMHRYDRLYYEIKHSADLFETFQRQRDEDTVHAAQSYLKTRTDKEEATRTQYKHELNASLESLKEAFKAFETNNKHHQNETLEEYKEALETIEKTKDDNLKTIADQATHEKRRLQSIISKLERQYEQDLKTLSQTKEQEKQACFNRKDDADKKLKELLTTRQKEADAYKNERETIKQGDLSRYRQNQATLLAKLEKEAIDYLLENDVKQIKAYLEGTTDSLTTK